MQAVAAFCITAAIGTSFCGNFSQLQQRIRPLLQTFKFLAPKFLFVFFIFPLRFSLFPLITLTLTLTLSQSETLTLSKLSILNPQTLHPCRVQQNHTPLHHQHLHPLLYPLARQNHPPLHHQHHHQLVHQLYAKNIISIRKFLFCILCLFYFG